MDELLEVNKDWPDRIESITKAHSKYYGSKDKVKTPTEQLDKSEL